MFQNCQTLRTDPIISVSEKNKKFEIKNPKQKKVNQVKIDGCVIKQGMRCDYLFEIYDEKVIKQVFYVELKGEDIRHGCEQLFATAEFCKEKHKDIQKSCYIVASRVSPSTRTTRQIFEKKLKQKYAASLVIKNKIYTVKI